MTEIEQMKADLATIQEAAEIAKIRGFHELAGNYDQVEGELKQKIAKLEAQEQVDPWERARGCVDYALKHYLHNSNGREIALYARHLEAKVADLEEEVRRALIVQSASVGKAKKFREKLAELTTITNAIPPACGEAQEIVKKRIEGVKKEMQGKQQKGDAGKTTDELDPRRVLATARDILKHYSQFISAEDGWETKNIQQAISTINFMAGTEAEPLKWEKQPHQSELEAKNEG